MKKAVSNSVIHKIMPIVIVVACLLMYFLINYIPCISTDKNLATCSEYYGTTDIREVVSARSAKDVTYKYNSFTDRTTIYYGKMTLNFWEFLDVTSLSAYTTQLNAIGITWVFNKDDELVMFFNEEELRMKEGG